MKIEEISILPFLILCVASMLFLSLRSSPSILECENLLGSSFSVVLMVFVFNTMIFAFLVKGYMPSYEEFDNFDWSLPFQLMVDGMKEEHEEYRCNNIDTGDDDDNDDYCYPCSDGYNEDDDDDSSDEEVGWADEEQDDDDLDKRIEEFIAKVNKGWREEWLRENLHDRFVV